MPGTKQEKQDYSCTLDSKRFFSSYPNVERDKVGCYIGDQYANESLVIVFRSVDGSFLVVDTETGVLLPISAVACPIGTVKQQAGALLRPRQRVARQKWLARDAKVGWTLTFEYCEQPF